MYQARAPHIAHVPQAQPNPWLARGFEPQKPEERIITLRKLGANISLDYMLFFRDDGHVWNPETHSLKLEGMPFDIRDRYIDGRKGHVGFSNGMENGSVIFTSYSGNRKQQYFDRGYVEARAIIFLGHRSQLVELIDSSQIPVFDVQRICDEYDQIIRFRYKEDSKGQARINKRCKEITDFLSNLGGLVALSNRGCTLEYEGSGIDQHNVGKAVGYTIDPSTKPQPKKRPRRRRKPWHFSL